MLSFGYQLVYVYFGGGENPVTIMFKYFTWEKTKGLIPQANFLSKTAYM